MVPRPTDKNVIETRTVITNKSNSEGSVKRKKAYIAARDSTQRPGFDYSAIFAPMTRFESIRLLTAMMTELGTKVQQWDVKTAYPNR